MHMIQQMHCTRIYTLFGSFRRSRSDNGSKNLVGEIQKRDPSADDLAGFDIYIQKMDLLQMTETTKMLVKVKRRKSVWIWWCRRGRQ